jgi:hypothetical protein
VYVELFDGRQRARKPYRCESCGCSIPTGTLYSRRTYKFEGQLREEKLHTYCRDELQWFFEMTDEAEFDFYDVQDFVTEELRTFGHDAYDDERGSDV